MADALRPYFFREMSKEIKLYLTGSQIEVEGDIPLRELLHAQQAGLIPEGDIVFKNGNSGHLTLQNGNHSENNGTVDHGAKVVFPAADNIPSRSLVHIETRKN